MLAPGERIVSSFGFFPGTQKFEDKSGTSGLLGSDESMHRKMMTHIQEGRADNRECIIRPVTAVGKWRLVPLGNFWEPGQDTLLRVSYPRVKELGMFRSTPTIHWWRLLLVNYPKLWLSIWADIDFSTRINSKIPKSKP